jgi:hypothetical protein
MKSIQELLETAYDTYNGKTGCACGCGGNYAPADSVSGQRRIKKLLNANPERVAFVPFSDRITGCVEIENQDGTRVTRIYVGLNS